MGDSKGRERGFERGGVSEMRSEFDTVIVGSGVAGITVAKQLLERNRSASILMLEAGPEVEAKNRRYWWDYVVNDRKPYAFTYDQPGENRSIGNTNYLIEGTRVNAYGGSTMHWGGWCLRYKPEDFELYSRTGEGGDWPFSYDHLEPYYCLAEEYLSVCGDASEDWMPRSKPYPRPPFYWTAADQEMIDAFEELGIKPGKMPIARYRKCMTTGTCKYCPIGARFNAQYINDELRADSRHSGFEIRCNSAASQILTRSKQSISGVRYVDAKTGDEHEVFAQTVVLASGAYEVPKLLLVSTPAEWPNGIGNDLDLVGRYVVSHSMLKVRGESVRNDEHWFQEYDFPTLMSRSYDTPEMQKDGKIFIFKNRALPNIDIAGLMIQGLSRSEIEAAVGGPRLQEVQAFLEEKGRYENRLTLAPGRNRFGLPRMKIDFNRTPAGRAAGQDRLNLLEKVIECMGYKVVYKALEDPGGHHTTGTCRMGVSPEIGVTDGDMKVHGTDNLYVCSNAAFPTGSAVNPTLTLAAMALRLGNHLASRSGGATFTQGGSDA